MEEGLIEFLDLNQELLKEEKWKHIQKELDGIDKAKDIEEGIEIEDIVEEDINHIEIHMNIKMMNLLNYYVSKTSSNSF